jgi:hypothetical protein
VVKTNRSFNWEVEEMKNRLSAKIVVAAAIVCTIVSGAVFAGQGQVKREIWLTSDIDESKVQVALDWISTYPAAGSVDSMTKIDFNGFHDNGITDPAAGGVDNYVARVTGWIVPKVTGNYFFRITSDDASGLWLSSDDAPPAGLTPETAICQVAGWTGYQDWNNGSAGKSANIALVGGQAYAFTAIMIEGGGGDHLSVAWASTDAGVSDPTVIEDEFISDTNPIRASIPTPASGTVNAVVDDLELKWVAPWALTNTKYSVYFGTLDTSDPNQTQDNPKIVADLTAPSFVVDNLATSTTYFWRVDCSAQDSNGLPVLNKGPLWSFTTVPATPVVFRQPREAEVLAGEKVTFDFTVYSAGDAALTYAWKKVGDPGFGSSDKDLVIGSAQVANEGDYSCEITNASGTVITDLAHLTIKRFIGYWPFDGNLNDMIGSNHGTAVGSPDLTAAGKVGSNSVKTSDGNYLYVPWTPTPSFSVSFLVLPEVNSGNDYIIGCGSPSGAENFFARMTNITTGYDVAFNNGGVRFAYLTYPVAWNHEVFTYDHPTRTAKWYINSVLVGTVSPLTLNPPIDPQIYVGNRKNGQRRFTGNIDELKLYNFAIDEYAVARLYVDSNPGTVICVKELAMDLNKDCRIGLEDFAMLAQEWLLCNRNPKASCP